MKFFGCRFLRALVHVVQCFLLTLCTAIAFYGLLHGEWNYALIGGEVKRSWCVYGPGFKQYISFEDSPAKICSYFDMQAPYRVTPWIDPEWETE